MKQILFVAVFTLVSQAAVASIVWQDTTMRPTGKDYLGWSKAERERYVTGYADCMAFVTMMDRRFDIGCMQKGVAGMARPEAAQGLAEYIRKTANADQQGLEWLVPAYVKDEICSKLQD